MEGNIEVRIGLDKVKSLKSALESAVETVKSSDVIRQLMSVVTVLDKVTAKMTEIQKLEEEKSRQTYKLDQDQRNLEYAIKHDWSYEV